MNLVLPENLQDIWMTEGYFTILVNRTSALQFLPDMGVQQGRYGSNEM